MSLYIPICKLRFGEIWVSDENLGLGALKKKGKLGKKEREKERKMLLACEERRTAKHP